VHRFRLPTPAEDPRLAAVDERSMQAGSMQADAPGCGGRGGHDHGRRGAVHPGGQWHDGTGSGARWRMVDRVSR